MILVSLHYNEGTRLFSATWKMEVPPMVGDYFNQLEFDIVMETNVPYDESGDPEWEDISREDASRLMDYDFIVTQRCWDYLNGMTVLLDKCESLDRKKWWGR